MHFQKILQLAFEQSEPVGQLYLKVFLAAETIKTKQFTKVCSTRQIGESTVKGFNANTQIKLSTESEPLSWRSQLLTKLAVITVLVFTAGASIWFNNTAWKNQTLLWEHPAGVVSDGVELVADRFSR